MFSASAHHNRSKTPWVLKLFFCFFAFTALAGAQDFLPAERAFIFTPELVGQKLELHWDIAPGYHLYRKRLEVTQNKQSIELPGLPAGHWVQQGPEKLEVYQDQLDITLPFKAGTPSPFLLEVIYQGCSESGLCYPPEQRYLRVDLTKGKLAVSNEPLSIANQPAASSLANPSTDSLKTLLTKQRWAAIAGAFFVLGLLLTFTPCVLPMLPILSSLIVGKTNGNTMKAGLISLAYIFGMATTYALLGLLAGTLGAHLQAWMQKPAFIIATSLLFIGLALSLFDCYTLQLPRFIERPLNQLSQKQSSGTYLGAAMMGVLGTLIVSPCVSPPLVAALSYIGQTGNAQLGAFALFAFGLGMGFPLFIVGTWGFQRLPKNGPWLNAVKYGLGIVMLGMAIWLLSRILPGPANLFLWGLLLVIFPIALGLLRRDTAPGWPRVLQACGLVTVFYGALLIIGAAKGHDQLLHPLASPQITQKTSLRTFTVVHSLAELQPLLDKARTNQQPVFLDFYADWCTSCQVISHSTLPNPQVQAALNGFMLIKADVTQGTQEELALQNHFGVVGPPSLLFFDTRGQEQISLRLIGEVRPNTLLKALNQLNAMKSR